MGTFFTGATGSLYVDGTRVAKVTDWSLNGIVEPLETTNTGDTAKTYASMACRAIQAAVTRSTGKTTQVQSLCQSC